LTSRWLMEAEGLTVASEVLDHTIQNLFSRLLISFDQDTDLIERLFHCCFHWKKN